ncbi:MarR family winged helix-turn-helix transcriptional regulator [Fimbriimonas ginsengisoli]|uniref:MarR family transcriptional regulator n=1 Tax=Fimbriimonas ginsengisoli Gsoil 348 TaxID=661478 RepID=A0A068NKP2_FIMGI|nr:MarR family transcriptional regulator [Fimbriimonas ginsengisoli]AIE84138.1 MarR family transcriptional regulator [Fimbriimonas ginsengisoli Gsoil 348]
MDDILQDAVLLEAILPRALRSLFRHDTSDPLAHLTVAQLRMVRTLRAKDWNAVDLAKDLAMTESAVSQTVKRLEEMGLVERRPDLHDRRVRTIGLSQIGAQLLRERQTLRVERARVALSKLSRLDRQTLIDLLSRLVIDGDSDVEPLALVAELEQALPLVPPLNLDPPKSR